MESVEHGSHGRINCYSPAVITRAPSRRYSNPPRSAMPQPCGADRPALALDGGVIGILGRVLSPALRSAQPKRANNLIFPGNETQVIRAFRLRGRMPV